VGGSAAKKGQFPWTIFFRITDEEGDTSSCTGALIDRVWVLTAAHCTDGEIKEITAYAGSTKRGEGQKRTANKIVNHPDYDTETKFNDISLFRVSKPFDINTSVKTIAISLLAASEKDTLTAAGFGDTSSGGSSSDNLLWVTLPFVPLNTCQKEYDLDGSIQVCAGKKGKDTCQGDSGGALVRTSNPSNADANLGIVGIVSFGNGCGTSPGVYSLASAYYDFISDVTGLLIPTISKKKNDPNSVARHS
jgi:secreted trypsin-like serine protease